MKVKFLLTDEEIEAEEQAKFEKDKEQYKREQKNIEKADKEQEQQRKDINAHNERQRANPIIVHEEELKKELKKERYHFRKALMVFNDDYFDLAERFWKIQPIYFDKGNIWWIWNFNRHCWEQIDKVDLINEIKEYASPLLNLTHRNIITQVISAMRQIARKHKPKDLPKTSVQFKGLVYDLETGECKDATHKYFNTNPIPFCLGDSNRTPNIDRIFAEWVGKEYVKTLKQIIGYCFLQDYPIHRIFCFVGGGCNGKSSFLELVKRILGQDNVASAGLDRIMATFGTAPLYKKLCCLMGETNYTTLKRTDMLKRLSGNDPVSFEFKNKGAFTGKSYATLLIASNQLPLTEDKSSGFYRRWLMIEFPNVFSEKKDILKDIPQEEYEGLCYDCFVLLKELLVKREFHNEGSIKERTKRYEQFSNPVMAFVKEKCLLGNDYQVPSWKFNKAFSVWIEGRGYKPISKTAVTQTLKKEEIFCTIKSTKVNKKIPLPNGKDRFEEVYVSWKYYEGIKLKEDLEQYDTKE